jgi:hypothetical protein
MTRIKLFAIGTLLFASTAQAKIPEATSENAIGLIAMLFTYQHECSPSDDLNQRDARTATAFAIVAGIDLPMLRSKPKFKWKCLGTQNSLINLAARRSSANGPTESCTKGRQTSKCQWFLRIAAPAASRGA